MQLHDDLPSMDTIRSCVDGLELERTQIGRRIEQLLPHWQARAQAADQLARLSPETMAELHDTGLLHLLTPRRYGGLQQDFPTLVEAARLAATACASTAWMLSVVGGHVTTAARLPAACQDIIFANGPRQLFATATVQNGTFVRDGSGFRLNGIWRYSSGIDHATWVIVSARLGGTDAPEAQEIFKVVVRREDVRVLDTWHVSGMRATGSRDIAFDKLYVSDEWVFARSNYFGPHPAGADLHPDAYLYDVPLIPYSTTWIIGPILGCAQGAYRHCIDTLRSRGRSGDAVLCGHIAKSDAELACAGRLYDALVRTLHTAGIARRAVSPAETVRIRRDRAFIAQLCVDAIRRLIGSMGTAVAFDAHPAQRHWRDLQVMAAHIDVGWDAAAVAYGGHAIAHSTDTSRESPPVYQ
ncbi:acyl-CoA dehydrogenase [Burkholderia sp. MS389]|uniref:acyl-CoA dehydrogenase family protein n=1 Tax=Burkholderia sp. MS389 TaxID=2811789 RepID=UPI00195BAAF7|nr:acyl-CoA dehydrogenase family protein [Burkholderia sp. MS389]QRR17597.1 acyl-CoA dehydrogenase [Burkholderia sp. MS389]